MMHQEQQQFKLKELIIQYVMTFGKKVDHEVQKFIQQNWDWNLGYQTKTTMLNSNLFHKIYNKQGFIARLQQAAAGDQAMSFIKFQEVLIEQRTIKWRGKFICSSFNGSPNYKIQSIFSPQGKFLQQKFTQIAEQSAQQAAPQISWKDANHF